MATTKTSGAPTSIALTEDVLRDRFKVLNDEIKAIHAISDPLRVKRDKFVNEARAKETEMNAAIREAEQGLFSKKSEQGMIVRALKGRTEGETNIAVTDPEAAEAAK